MDDSINKSNDLEDINKLNIIEDVKKLADFIFPSQLSRDDKISDDEINEDFLASFSGKFLDLLSQLIVKDLSLTYQNFNYYTVERNNCKSHWRKMLENCIQDRNILIDLIQLKIIL
jgi:hypothetical protein